MVYTDGFAFMQVHFPDLSPFVPILSGSVEITKDCYLTVVTLQFQIPMGGYLQNKNQDAKYGNEVLYMRDHFSPGFFLLHESLFCRLLRCCGNICMILSFQIPFHCAWEGDQGNFTGDSSPNENCRADSVPFRAAPAFSFKSGCKLNRIHS